MKRIKQVLVIAGSVLAIASCQNPDQREDRIANENEVATGSQRYIDPNTGAPVDLYYNAHEKMTYNRENDKPVKFYVNTNTGDTIYGNGRYVVNGYIIRGEDGIFRLNDAKVTMDKDGLKIIGDNGKLKMDGDDMKFKDGDDYKYKVDGDEIKIKDGDKKIKKEAGKPTKVKED
jgi:hypothetical protein